MEPGQAYGFFQCMDPKPAVARTLEDSRPFAGVKPDLSLSLYEQSEFTPDPGNQDLCAATKIAFADGTNYVVKAESPSKGNRDVADDVRTLLDLLSQSDLNMGGASGGIYWD